MLRSLLRSGRPIRASSAGTPSDIIRVRIIERERLRRRRKDPTRDDLFVEVPESSAWLDTATMPMVLTAVAIALFTKLLMMEIVKDLEYTLCQYKGVKMEGQHMFPQDCPIAVFPLLLLHHDATAQERLERKIQKAPPEQGTVRMLSREEWDEIQEIRPRTPFESNLARPNARLRTGEPIHLDDVKDWTIDVLTDALTRAEESAKQR